MVSCRSFSMVPLAAAIVLPMALSDTAPGQDMKFHRADVNADGAVDLGDAVGLLVSLYLKPQIRVSCLDAADANDDGILDISDVVRILAFLFLGAETPPAPYGTCGGDPTGDGLGCAAFGPCDPALEISWMACHDGPGHGADEAIGMALDGEGNIILVGKESAQDQGFAYGVMKYGPDGREIWAVHYQEEPGCYNTPFALAVDAGGNAVITGQGLDPGSSTAHATTIKYDPAGNLLWSVSLDSKWGAGNSLALDPNGDICIAAEFIGFDGAVSHLVVKYAPDGQEIWRDGHSYDGPHSSISSSGRIAADPQGGVLAGFNDSFFDMGPFSTVLRYGSDAGRLWSVRNDECAKSNIFSVALDGQGYAYVAYEWQDSDDVPAVIRTVRYEPGGAESWSTRFPGQGEGAVGFPVKLRLDGAGNVHVAGAVEVEGRHWDFAVIKYDRDGRRLWAAQGDAGTLGRDTPWDLFLDPAGNVFVTGDSEGTGSGDDWLTLMYDRNGRLLWSARFEGPAQGHDSARAIAVDASGGIYVAGSTTSLDADKDFLLIKYAPRTTPGP